MTTEKEAAKEYIDNKYPDLGPNKGWSELTRNQHKDSFLAGSQWRAGDILERANNWLKADPLCSFEVNNSAWRLFDYLEEICKEKG